MKKIILFIIMILCVAFDYFFIEFYDVFYQMEWLLIIFFLTQLTATVIFYYLLVSAIGFISKKTLFYTGGVIGAAEKSIRQLDEIEFKKYKEYYREILKINSPMILGYLDNLRINKYALIAHILYMKEKGILIVENGEIKKNNSIPKKELSAVDKQILNRINNNKLRIKSFADFFNELIPYVSEEAKKQSLIKKKSKLGSELERLSSILKDPTIMIEILLVLSILLIFFSKLWIDVMVWAFFILIGVVIWYFFGKFLYRGYEKNSSIRTKKGKELNEKLEGLKNYIKDFSLLSERESKEIELWEDYLIYSVMFGQNEKIIEEYEKYIEIK